MTVAALPYLQYLVPHSMCSLQPAPTGFMLFQRHRSDRLVRWSKPFHSSGRGIELTCEGKEIETPQSSVLILFIDGDKTSTEAQKLHRCGGYEAVKSGL